MLKTIAKQATAPLISLFTFMLATGLFNTLLIIRMHQLHASSLMIGALTGVYYLGIVIGCLGLDKLIIRIGHIRAFSAMASILTVISLLHAFFLQSWFWLILRLFAGYATAGIYIVIESWLLVKSTNKTRGQILALYLIIFYTATAFGQFLINISTPENFILYALVAMLCSLAVIPLSMTKVASPQFDQTSNLNLSGLYQLCASGLISAFIAGIVLGAIYGLLPLYVMQQHNDTSEVALFMAIVIFGGMLLQYPMGRLSDYIERRKVLIAICLFTVIAASTIIILSHFYWPVLIALFILGGLTFTIYPISTSYACDSLDSNNIVSGTQGIVLFNSIGAAIGPPCGALLMHVFGSSGLFVFIIAMVTTLGVFLSWRTTQSEAAPQEEQFMTVVQTSPILTELDPRIE